MNIFDLFKKIEKNEDKPKENISFLVVCLGNPGDEYKRTRHNAGFMFSDKLCDKYSFKPKKAKFKALCEETVISGRRTLVMLPQTYMNSSGEAVKEAVDFYKIPIENVIVISDDVNLDVGKIRIRRNGSDGGQKGLRSIIGCLASDQFPRVRIGVGKKPSPDYDMVKWVLGVISENDFAEFDKALSNALGAVELIIEGKTEEAMCKFN